jgi:hypothetical protein
MIQIPNYREIFDAWITSFKPNEIEKKLSEERLEICLKCEFRKEIIKKNNWSSYCNRCGCPINKKIFSKLFNPCPEKLWDEVDKKYGINLEHKDGKTLI